MKGGSYRRHPFSSLLPQALPFPLLLPFLTSAMKAIACLDLSTGNLQGETSRQLCFGPWEGGAPLYRPYRYAPPQRVWFWRCFGLKKGSDFAHFSLESGMLYKGTSVVYECVCCFNIINEKKKEKSFCWRTKLGNGDIFSVNVNTYLAFCDHLQV